MSGLAHVTGGSPVKARTRTIDDLFPGVRLQRRRHRQRLASARDEEAWSHARHAYTRCPHERPFGLVGLTVEGSATPAAAVDELDTTFLPHHEGASWFVRRWYRCANEYDPARSSAWTNVVTIDSSSLIPTGYIEWDANVVQPMNEPLTIDASNLLLNDAMAISASNLLPTCYIDWDANVVQPLVSEVIFAASPSVHTWEQVAEESEPEEIETIGNLRSPAFRAFTELRAWLGLTVPEATALIGVGRTTPNAWERDGREPRPRQARRLYELDALVGTLVRSLGLDQMRVWLQQGQPSPQQLMELDQIGAFADAVESVVMGPARPPRYVPGGEIADDTTAARVAPGGARRRVVVRRRRR